MRTKEEIKNEIKRLKKINEQNPDDTRTLFLTSARYCCIKYLKWILSEREDLCGK